MALFVVAHCAIDAADRLDTDDDHTEDMAITDVGEAVLQERHPSDEKFSRDTEEIRKQHAQ